MLATWEVSHWVYPNANRSQSWLSSFFLPPLLLFQRLPHTAADGKEYNSPTIFPFGRVLNVALDFAYSHPCVDRWGRSMRLKHGDATLPSLRGPKTPKECPTHISFLSSIMRINLPTMKRTKVAITSHSVLCDRWAVANVKCWKRRDWWPEIWSLLLYYGVLGVVKWSW